LTFFYDVIAGASIIFVAALRSSSQFFHRLFYTVFSELKDCSEKLRKGN